METLLDVIHDPTISLNSIFDALEQRLGQNDAKAIVGAGLVQMHEHLKINLGDLIAYITNNEKVEKQLNHDEYQHEIKDFNKNEETSEQARKFVFENKDLCCKIASHFNSMEINQNIIFINKHFYNICNNPQTYKSHKFSKKCVSNDKPLSLGGGQITLSPPGVKIFVTFCNFFVLLKRDATSFE